VMDTTVIIIILILLCCCSGLFMSTAGSGAYYFGVIPNPLSFITDFITDLAGDAANSVNPLSGLGIGCIATKDTKEDCTKDCECKGGRGCGRLTAADGAKTVCCPAGTESKTFGAHDYCYGMPDGSVCWSDAMCKTGYCRGNAGGTQKGVCGKLKSGTVCSKDADCDGSRGCGRLQRGDSKTVCCPPGTQVGTYGGYDYCYGMADGKKCFSDAMCKSKHCRTGGICGKLQSRAVCSKDADCDGDRGCGRLQAGDSKTVCCPPGTKVGTYGGYDYCYGMPDGYKCKSDAMCKSGSCIGGKCVRKKNAGETCEGGDDDQCKSGKCGWGSSADNAKHICCPGEMFTKGGADYCQNYLPNGGICRWDAQCKSNYCKGNTFGRGVCRSP